MGPLLQGASGEAEDEEVWGEQEEALTTPLDDSTKNKVMVQQKKNKSFQVGDKITYNDHPGVIVKVGAGDQEGVYVVRMARGMMTVRGSQLESR